MCPPSFIEIASKEEWNLTNLYYYYYCAYNNNSEDETTQKQDPIPLLGEWDNNKEDKIQLFQDPIPLQGEWDNKMCRLLSILEGTLDCSYISIRDVKGTLPLSNLYVTDTTYIFKTLQPWAAIPGGGTPPPPRICLGSIFFLEFAITRNRRACLQQSTIIP